ncbi:hypothetical protein RRG08_049961 [Elysia crispata]|uniref:Uncharacterized protein n=1 Tax=Elysia crispata TaxID=231223 RepID=A0AAE0YSX2_9GAST|nr:hypothetical protein RRG08_049961 [Elysia crispata]
MSSRSYKLPNIGGPCWGYDIPQVHLVIRSADLTPNLEAGRLAEDHSKLDYPCATPSLLPKFVQTKFSRQCSTRRDQQEGSCQRPMSTENNQSLVGREVSSPHILLLG